MNTRKLNARSEISFLEQKVDSYFDDQGPSLTILILCAEFTHSYDNCSKPKVRNDNFKVCFVVPCTLGNPSTERFTGQEAPLGCFQLNPEVRHISVPNSLLTVRSLVWPLLAPPQKEIMLSPPIKLAGSQSADFCLAAESLSSYKC